jgi:hypothetical protein
LSAPADKRYSLGIDRFQMTTPTRKPFSVRPHDGLGWWLSDDRRFAENARTLLLEFESVVAQVNAAWPKPLGETLRDGEHTPELWALVRKRDLLSDAIRTFSAMAAEAFLNFYGVVRLGEEEYSTHFERLGLIPKLRQIFLICDGLSISDQDPLVENLRLIAQSRNSLLHPKAKELAGYVPAEDREGVKIPDAARDAVRNMNAFFERFVEAVPDAEHLVPPKT